MDTRPALIAIILVICVLSAGCASLLPAPSPQGPTELTLPSWRLVSYYDGNGTMVPVGPRIHISLKFDEEGNVRGIIDGCRRYSGRYTTMGETIKVANLTEIYEGTCSLSQETVEIENISFSLLQKSSRFNVNEGTLVFGYYDTQRYLVFART